MADQDNSQQYAATALGQFQVIGPRSVGEKLLPCTLCLEDTNGLVFTWSGLLNQLPPAPGTILLIGKISQDLCSSLRRSGYTPFRHVGNSLPESCVSPAWEPEEEGSPPASLVLPDQSFTQKFDVILSSGALREVQNVEEWFRAAKRLLAPTGRLFLCEATAIRGDEAGEHAAAKGIPGSLWSVAEGRIIEQAFGAQGFYVEHNSDWTREAGVQCQAVLAIPGEQSAPPQETSQYEGETTQSRATRLLAELSAGRLGFEYWVLAPSDFIVRGYAPGDESQILGVFNQVFGTHRTQAHWRWKYLDNPHGQTWLGMVLDGDRLVAHYAAYPVPLYLQGRMQLGCQAADAFSVPGYRKVGHGATALMSRAFRYFERVNCEQRLAFGHGFNVNKIQKLGRRFWQHEVPAPVFQRLLEPPAVASLRGRSSWGNLWRGYSVHLTSEVGDWANEVFRTVRDDYGWLVARDRTYLTWRYQQCPDMAPLFAVVHWFGRPVGWLVGRAQERTWLLGDALFAPRHAKAALDMALQAIFRHQPEIERVDSWFSAVPLWWNQVLDQAGFLRQRQYQELDLVVRFYRAKLSAQDIATNFYFTWGDSDLY